MTELVKQLVREIEGIKRDKFILLEHNTEGGKQILKIEESSNNEGLREVMLKRFYEYMKFNSGQEEIYRNFYNEGGGEGKYYNMIIKMSKDCINIIDRDDDVCEEIFQIMKIE